MNNQQSLSATRTTKPFRPIRVAGPYSAPIAVTTLPEQDSDLPELECHDWFADRRPDVSDDGTWVSLYGLASDWN